MKKNKISIPKLLMTIFLGVTTISMLFPLLWMLTSSFKLEVDVFNYPIEWIPKKWNAIENYKEVWFGSYNFSLYYINTIKVSVLVTIIQLFVASTGAYAFAKINFKGKDAIFALFISTLMIPDQVTIVPKFMLLKWFKLLDTHVGLVLLLVFSVYGLFLLRQYMITIPDALIESAKIDGANHFRIFAQLIIPISKPAIATLAILRFVWTWNDYQHPLIFLSSKNLYTLQIGMSQFASESGTYYALLMAASVSAVTPLLLVFIAGQKYIIEGISAGAVKG